MSESPARMMETRQICCPCAVRVEGWSIPKSHAILGTVGSAATVVWTDPVLVDQFQALDRRVRGRHNRRRAGRQVG